MGQEKLYIEKELSWLSFNERVLQEAADKSNPLIERMRFLGIYSNNLDEFYKVRFAELKRRIIISEEQGSNSHSRHLLGKIQSRVLKADQEFDGLYNELLLEMARNQIFLINERQLSVNQQNSSSSPGQGTGQSHRGGGLADTALTADHRDGLLDVTQRMRFF